MPFQPGPQHLRWKRGWTLHPKGYRRITAGPDRDRLAHRVVIEKLLGGPIPPGFEVHHMDFNRACICTWNLLLLDDRLHHPKDRRRMGAQSPTPESPPQLGRGAEGGVGIAEEVCR